MPPDPELPRDEAADDDAGELIYDYPLAEEDVDADDWRRDEGAAQDYDWLEAPAEVEEPTRAQEVGWRLRGLAYALAFAVPLLVLLGLALALSGQGEDAAAPPSEEQAAAAIPSPTVNGAWPPGVVFAPHTVPAIIRDELAALGAQHGYLFHGETGDIWEIAVEPVEAGTLDPEATLYGPTGEIVALSELRPADGPAAIIVHRLPQRGDYRLVVEGGVGTYVLSLFAE